MTTKTIRNIALAGSIATLAACTVDQGSDEDLATDTEALTVEMIWKAVVICTHPTLGDINRTFHVCADGEDDAMDEAANEGPGQCKKRVGAYKETYDVSPTESPCDKDPGSSGAGGSGAASSSATGSGGS